MRVDELILELQDMVNDAKQLPFSKDNKVLVSGDRIFDILEQLEDNLPSEIRQAKGVVADRDRIIAAANEKYDDMIKQAEERRKAMVSQSEIVKAAEAQAKVIISDAKKKSNEMQRAANDYVDGLLSKVDESLSAQANEIKRMRKEFKASAK
ncbi:MAG: ATPase [Ruminococcus sp.]